MKFVLTVKMVGSDQTWEEDYNENVTDAEKYCHSVIQQFNDTLRPHEQPREFVSVRVIADKLNSAGDVVDAASIKHSWSKTNAVTIIPKRGASYDLVKCTTCGVTAKRMGLGHTYVRDSKFRAKKYLECNWLLEPRSAQRSSKGRIVGVSKHGQDMIVDLADEVKNRRGVK